MIGGPYTLWTDFATAGHRQEMGGVMGPVNWVAVIAAGAVAAGLRLAWAKAFGRHPGSYAGLVIVALIASAMLGHAFARIGSETLDAKPWLYFMQTGGIALAFIIPALWLAMGAANASARLRWQESVYWLGAFLAIGGVFWVL